MIFRLFVLLLLILISSCGNPKNEKPKFYIDNIIIEYFGLSSQTPVSINCNLFDSEFLLPKDSIVINKNLKEYSEIKNLLHNFSNNSNIMSLDTRLKLSFKEDTLCLDKFGNYYSKKFDNYLRNDSLTNYIFSLISFDATNEIN